MVALQQLPARLLILLWRGWFRSSRKVFSRPVGLQHGAQALNARVSRNTNEWVPGRVALNMCSQKLRHMALDPSPLTAVWTLAASLQFNGHTGHTLRRALAKVLT